MSYLVAKAIGFAVFMFFVNFFVLYKNHEGRRRKSILGAVIAGVIFGVVLYLL